MEVTKITAYHGTDNKYLHSILNNGFQCKTNDEHWLGNGVYFFIEYHLAEWWAMNEHKDFGKNITNPIIIEVNISSSKDTIVDLRILDDFNWIAKKYDEFQDVIFQYGSTSNNKIDYRKLRCSFFDWINKSHGKKIIIGGFQKNNCNYINNKLPTQFRLPYIEYQVCVYDNSIININKYQRCDKHERQKFK